MARVRGVAPVELNSGETNVTLHLDNLDTPLGTVALVVDDAGYLRACGFTVGHTRMTDLLSNAAVKGRATRNPGGVTHALRSYFEGDVRAVETLPVKFEGTPFQQRVWSALQAIPCGQVWSYAQLARHIGQEGSARAVGLANARNPMGIVVPCHRVVGSNGELTGYAGGLQRKRWLLEHEGAQLRSHRPVADALVGGGVADALRGEPELVQCAR